jgi:magnesium-transporting ATPase (P-type)
LGPHVRTDGQHVRKRKAHPAICVTPYRYAIIGTYVGAVTAFGFIWWFLYFEDGPKLPLSALRNSASCVEDKTAGYSCSVFQHRGPSTIAMSVLVVVEMFNALNAISENGSLLVQPPWANTWLVWAIIVSMLLHCAILCASSTLPQLCCLHHLVAMHVCCSLITHCAQCLQRCTSFTAWGRGLWIC